MDTIEPTAAPKPIELSEEQRAVLADFAAQRNLLVTGSAGTGKSTLLRAMLEQAKGQISVCASTGIAAVNVGGMTVHSWAGIGLAENSAKQMAAGLSSKKNEAYWRIVNCKVLAIDEISMIGSDLFTKLDWTLRYVRKEVAAPFGGIQLVLFGDFLQLPPVGQADDGTRFCFESPSWNEARIKTVMLTKVFRQEDQLFSAALNDLREGRVSAGAKAILNARHTGHSQPADTLPDLKAVIVHTHNADVDQINRGILVTLPGEPRTFHAVDTGRPKELATLQKNCLAPAELELRIGAQVMLLKNLDPLGGLANGSIGIVTGYAIFGGYPMVKFANGITRSLERAEWSIKDGDTVLASRSQIPLRLAWAITTHKCIHPDTLIETEWGLERIGDAADGYHVSTVDGRRDRTELIRYNAGPAVCITTVRGYEIRATLNHGMVVCDAAGTRRVDAGNLVVGDTLRLVRGSCFPNGSYPGYLPPLPNGDVRAVKYDVPHLVDSDVAEFMGLMVADGTVFGSGFRMAKRHQDVADRFDALCRKLFKCEPSRFFKLNAHHVEVSSTLMREWLRRIGGMSPNKKAVPEVILRSTVKNHCAFLRGLFEDGGVSRKHGRFSGIEWTTAVEQMAADVQVMLLRIGIVSTRAK